jgi:hypothetical protein
MTAGLMSGRPLPASLGCGGLHEFAAAVSDNQIQLDDLDYC